MRRASAVRFVVVSLVLAVGLSMQLAPFARAWSNYCPWDYLCVWRDRDLSGPIATTSVDISIYTGNYPGSSSPINDSISSFYAHSGANGNGDIRFFNEAYWQGAVFCGDSGIVYTWVGLFNNDAWSSHKFTGTDYYC